MSSARELAVKILVKCEKERSYSNLEIKNALKSADFSTADRAFLTQLVNGVLEKSIALDFYLKGFFRKSIRLSPFVKNILRLGAYQIIYLDRVPVSAACNEAVILAKKFAGKDSSGFVNGVLRNLSRNKDNLTLPDYSENPLLHLSVKYSLPQWIISLWQKSYGEEIALKLLEATIEKPLNTIRINNIKTDFDELREQLLSENIKIEKSKLLENAAYIDLNRDLEGITSYEKGFFHIQDLSSQACCHILSPQKNETILDVCAAPGGKSFTISELMENTGQIFALDLHEHRTLLIKKGAQRLGLKNIKTFCADASKPLEFEKRSFDRILCDVPCSGLGVISKKPDIMFKSEEEIKELPELQLNILKNASEYLKKGGTLIYSTCTLNHYENEDIINAFIKGNSEFILKDINEVPENFTCINAKGYVTILPTKHCDGFFIAKLMRVE